MNCNYLANAKRCGLLVLASLVAGLPTPSQSAVTAFDWTVVPSSFESSVTVPIGNGLLTVMRSGYTGGVYPVDVTNDGIPDGSLSAEAELETSVLFDGLAYTYSWKLSNLGSGAFTVSTPGEICTEVAAETCTR